MIEVVPAHRDPDMGGPVKIPLDPEKALRALMQVKPDDKNREPKKEDR